ncbi:MAG: DNA gyrase subunit A [Firmicutes bacterium]|nr:DNA gyrase subunit A [Bacillota bacterium]
MKHEEEIKDIEFPDQKIIDVGMHDEVKKSFIAYSMSVITARALPDIRDGMKPSQRRILYAMYEDRLTYDKAYRKSATTVGNVLGRYHPHGDSSVYQAMVRMAQPFSYRYPLIDGNGNFGSVDGDPPAAYRYTEARMSRIANEMMADIEKDVVDFRPNFDNRLKEPVVLPSRIPNLLVNGSVGIAVGMATNIPPHNLGEAIDAEIYMMDNPEATLDELMSYIKGPDFPTGATIYGTAGIYEAYMTGKGHITVRSKTEIDEEHRRIIATEIPYAVNKSVLVESIANLVKDKRVDGITGLRDESGRGGMRIVVEYRRDVNPQILLNQLFKYTQLQDTFAVNMVALVGGEPKTCSLRDMLGEHIRHQEEVVTRRLRFELEKARREAHIYEGYKIAIDNIDEVIEIIKGSASIPDAKAKLGARFGLDDVQTQAIVEMTLGRLSGLEREKIEARLAALYEEIERLVGILSDEEKLKALIKEEMLAIKQKYADARRTEIVPVENEIMIEDLIDRHNCIITITHEGYVKRQRSDVYSAQRRGGKGIIGTTKSEEDFIERVISVDSHSYILMFTDKGRVYMKKAYQIPEAGRTSKGTNIANIIETEPGEKLTAIVAVDGFVKGLYLTMVTKNGKIKRTPLTEFEYQRRGGKRAISFEGDDELIFVKVTDGEREFIVAGENGRAVRFAERTIRPQGRTAMGVRAIKLAEGEHVADAAVVEEGKTLFTLTEKGLGKRTEFSNYDTKHRGGLGVISHKLTSRTGKLIGIAAISDEDDIIVISDTGIIMRTSAGGIGVMGRSASGVIVMKTGEGARVASFTQIAAEAEKTETPVDGGEDYDVTTDDAASEDGASEDGDTDSDEYEEDGIDEGEDEE